MKQLVFLFFSGCLITSYCSAQELEKDPSAGNPKKSPSEPLLAVTFTPNDTCNLVINGKDYGEVARNSPKTIRLYPGYHRFFFESLETGEAIKVRSFRLTKDSLTNGRYTYPVVFK